MGLKLICCLGLSCVLLAGWGSPCSAQDGVDRIAIENISVYQAFDSKTESVSGLFIHVRIDRELAGNTSRRMNLSLSDPKVLEAFTLLQSIAR